MNDLLFGIIVTIISLLVGIGIQIFIKGRKFTSKETSPKKTVKISIGGNQFEISQEKKREFDLLSSTIIIKDPKTGLAIGTGFVTNERNAITTFHVVKIVSSNLDKVINVNFAITDDIYQVRVVETLIDQDIAILEFDKPLPPDVVPLELDPNNIYAGNNFTTFGYSGEDSHGFWAKGKIDGRTKSTYKNQEKIQLSSSEIFPGMSGAPIVDERTHKVIGILTAFYNDKERRSSTTAFAIPVDSNIVKKVEEIRKSN